MKRNTRSKAENEYVKTLIHNLSLQRLSDLDIVDYLNNEKQIPIARTTVNKIRNKIEKSAERWYIDLKQSRYKYIATYKERLDSLLSYQKLLHGIISTTKKDEVKIRAISELTSIEMNIFNLWRQLPELDIMDRVKTLELEKEQEEPSIVDAEDINGSEVEPWDTPSWLQCDGCKRWWKNQELLQYHKIRGSCTANTPTITVPIAESASAILSETGQGGEGDGWKKLQCPSCKQCFMNNFSLSAHKCTSSNNN